MNRKRPTERGPEDDVRPHKRRLQGAPAASSNPASAEKCDPPALISLADGSRRYDEFKGDIGKLPCAYLGQALFRASCSHQYHRRRHLEDLIRRRRLLPDQL